VTVRAGEFGLQRGTGWAMWCVRLGTRSRYGHACLAVTDAVSVDGVEYLQIVEAMPEGVRTRRSRVDEWAWSHLDLTDEQRWAVAAGALTDVGKPYDWPSVAGFIIRRFWARFTGQSKDHPDDHLMCSEEVVWRHLVSSGLDMFPGRAPNTVSPGDLAQYDVEH